MRNKREYKKERRDKKMFEKRRNTFNIDMLKNIDMQATFIGLFKK